MATVDNTTTRWAYTGNGVTTAFAYDNLILAATDLNVYLDGVEQGSGFTVTGAGDADGGNVTFTVAPAAAVAVLLTTDMPSLQPTNFKQDGDIDPDDIETALARVHRLVQVHAVELTRTLKLADSDSEATLAALPAKAARLGKALTFHATTGVPEVTEFASIGTALGNALSAIKALTPAADKIAYFTSATAAALAGLTSFGRSLIAAASAAAARNVLGLGTAAVEAVATGGSADLARADIPVDEQIFNSSDTWTKPTKGAVAMIESWAPGGGGARRSTGNGSGGGGGGYERLFFDLADLGATETVTIGSGGAVQATDNTDGNAGGTNSFGAHFSHYGGRGGRQVAAGTIVRGAGGASLVDIWTTGRSNSDGNPGGTAVLSNTGGQQHTLNEGSASGATAANAVAAAADVFNAYWRAGGGAGHETTGAGSGVAATSVKGGDGGDGNAGGAGVNGTAPGGGGGSGTTQGGSGADGRIIVTVW
ncbi:MAG: hypothetical protein U1A72_16860 [Sulfuritalea sp.]|nr:hypothetical protein [Sulfuritalea sp.]